MAARIRARTPVSSCPGCLSWGPSYGSRSYCRACYDFVSRYPRAVCTGCQRLIAVKKNYCRLCWLQAAIFAEGRPRITAQDFRPIRYWQLSLAGLTRLGHIGPPAETVEDEPVRPPPGTDQMQLKLFPLGESWLAGRRHWVASTITNDALVLTRNIAGELGEIRSWSPRIVIETNRRGDHGLDLDFSVGFTMTDHVQEVILALPEYAWTPAVQVDGSLRERR